ncbi:MAG: dephospho-CoA kinase [Bacteroidales bacterium]|jgi:dephospho-CoA kinase|nr:dephospho-CoA kinase [Bacteroidales bacterium]
MKVGIAGGIGGGKSSIAKAFENLGIPVFYADPQARELMKNSPQIKSKLIQAFGSHIYHGNQLNKAALSKLIFSDDKARETINKIVHPEVRLAFERWAKSCHSDTVMIEAAILFDTGLYKTLDATILVLANDNHRLKRIMSRDNMSEEEARKRFASQQNPENHKKLATFLINNNDEAEVLPQILNIYNKIKQNG